MNSSHRFVNANHQVYSCIEGLSFKLIFPDNFPCRWQFKCYVSTHRPRPASSAQTKIVACLSEIPSQIRNCQIELIVTQIELLLFSDFFTWLIQPYLIHIHSKCFSSGCLATSFSHTNLLLTPRCLRFCYIKHMFSIFPFKASRSLFHLYISY